MPPRYYDENRNASMKIVCNGAWSTDLTVYIGAMRGRFDSLSLRILAVVASQVVLTASLAAAQSPANGLPSAENWVPGSNTSGAAIDLEETALKQDGHRAVFTYRLYATGADPAGEYEIAAWPSGSQAPVAEIAGVTLAAGGLAVCSGRPGLCGDPAKPDDPIDLSFPVRDGEPIRLLLISKDGHYRAFLTTIPLPIVATDNGCTLNVEVSDPAATAVTVKTAGFAPNAQVQIETVSSGESGRSTARADAQGHFSLVIVPAVKGKSNGTLTLTVKGPTCAPHVSVDWGS